MGTFLYTNGKRIGNVIINETKWSIPSNLSIPPAVKFVMIKCYRRLLTLLENRISDNISELLGHDTLNVCQLAWIKSHTKLTKCNHRWISFPTATISWTFTFAYDFNCMARNLVKTLFQIESIYVIYSTPNFFNKSVLGLSLTDFGVQQFIQYDNKALGDG